MRKQPLRYPEASLEDILISKTKDPRLVSLRRKLVQSLSSKEGYQNIDSVVISDIVNKTIEETSINISIIKELVRYGFLTEKEARSIVHRALQNG